MAKTLTITLEQAQTALQCVEQVDVASDVAVYLRRAELAQRLRTAINNANKEN